MPKSTSRRTSSSASNNDSGGGSAESVMDGQQSSSETSSNNPTNESSNNNSKNKRIVKTPYTKRACISCHKAKVKCSHERPCQRCTTKNIECVDYIPVQQQQQQQQQQQLATLNNNNSALSLLPAGAVGGTQFCPMILVPTTAVTGVGGNGFGGATLFPHHALMPAMPGITTTNTSTTPSSTALALQPTMLTSNNNTSLAPISHHHLMNHHHHGFPASALATAGFNQIVDVTDSINNDDHEHNHHADMIMDGNLGGDESPFLSTTKQSPLGSLLFNDNDDPFASNSSPLLPLPHHHHHHHHTNNNTPLVGNNLHHHHLQHSHHHSNNLMNDEGVDESIIASELVRDDDDEDDDEVELLNTAHATTSNVTTSSGSATTSAAAGSSSSDIGMELQPYKASAIHQHNNNNDIAHLGNLICMVLQRQDKQARDLKELKDDILEIKKHLLPKGNNNGRKSSALRPID